MLASDAERFADRQEAVLRALLLHLSLKLQAGAGIDAPFVGLAVSFCAAIRRKRAPELLS